MANGPTVTAIIEAQDKASPIIQAFMRHVQDAAGSAGKASNAAAGSMVDSHHRALDTMSSRLGKFYSQVNESSAVWAAAAGAHMLHSVMDVGKVMENEQRKLMSFSNTTVDQMERIRRQIDSTFSTVKGGPEGAMEAVRAGALSGVKAENVADALPTIALHATETNESMEHSAEALIGLANMLGSFHDAVGKAISAGAASRDQFIAGMKDAENVAISANMVAPGSLREQVEAIKVVAPTAQSLGLDRADMLALIANMSENGVGGSHGGQYIKSAASRLAAPTAPMRSAIASQGLHLSDYQHVNPGLLNEKGIEAGLTQALGPLNVAMKAAVHTALDRFKVDANQETFQSSMVDAIRKDGGKKSPVVASNIAERVLAPAVTGIDLVKLLDDVGSHGGGTGALIAMFGKETGGALGRLIGPELDRLRGEFKKSLGEDHVSHALEENADSYTTKIDGLSNSLKGLEDQLFIGLKPAIEAGASGLTGLVQQAAGASAPVHEAMDALLVGGTALAALKTGGTLATWAINLGKVAGVVEEAGPVLGGLAALAGIEFLPAVAGLAAITAGIEAFVHRGELWHAFENWKNGDSDAPRTPEDAQALRDKVEAARKSIADRHAELAQNIHPNNAVMTAQEDANHVLMRALQNVGSDPAVVAAEAHRDVVSRERPHSDADYLAARDHAADLRGQLAKREAMANGAYIRAIDKAMAEMSHRDPNAGDGALDGLRAQRSELKDRLPSGSTTSTEIAALDGLIVSRMAENQAKLDAALAAEKKLREDALTAMGAPNVSKADVDRADRLKDDALTRAEAKQEADRKEADERVAKAKNDILDAARHSPEFRDAQAKADALRDAQRAEVERHAEGDSRIAALRHEIASAEDHLAIYDRAFAISHPTFTRMGMTGLPEAPNFGPPPPSYGPVPAPRTGPAFDLNGPVASGGGGGAGGPNPDVLAALRGNGAEMAAAVRGGMAGVLVKADPVHVFGTVSGSAEVATTIGVHIEPSPMFMAAMAHAEYTARIAMEGKMGESMGEDFMGSNGSTRPMPTQAKMAALGGIGHM